MDLRAPVAASRGVSNSDQDFRRLFEREQAGLHRFLFRLTRNASDADDLLQETFLTVWRKREQFEGRGSAEGWLRRTAFRLYLNSRTRTDRRADLAPRGDELTTESPAESGLERRESVEFLVAKVLEAVRTLPDGAREAFVLFRCEGLSCSEIAEITGTPLKTVETRLLRATRQVADRLRPFRREVP